MKITVLLVLCLGYACAGFCDSARYSGYRCDRDESKYCACKVKKGKRKCDKTTERFCPYGCSSGRCSLPPTPAPANEVCATSTITDAPILATCPNLGGSYRTWQDKQQSTAWLTEAAGEIAIDISWWKVDLMPLMVTLSDDNVSIDNYTALGEFVPTMTAAWTAQCEQDASEFSCMRMVPECRMDAGHVDQCLVTCPRLDVCIASVSAACEAVASQPDSIIGNCSSYKDLFSEYLNADGVRDCAKLCAINQNDFVSPAARTAFMSVSVIVVCIAAMLF